HCNAKQAPDGVGMGQAVFGRGELRLQICVTGCSSTASIQKVRCSPSDPIPGSLEGDRLPKVSFSSRRRAKQPDYSNPCHGKEEPAVPSPGTA
ncbi:unnamed protein product, partial [Bubo scandiacus]